MHGQKRGKRAEPTGVQPVGIGGPRPTLGGGESQLAAIVRTAPPAGTDGDLEPARRFPGPGLGQPASHGCPVLIVDMDVDPRRFVGGDAQRLQQGQPRADLVTAANPVGDVGEQERAAAHRPADPPRNAPQGQHQHRQHIAADVDSQVVPLAADRPAQLPDRAEQAPAAGVPLEPGPLGDPDPVHVGVGLEDLVIARRGQHVDRRRRIGRSAAGRAAGW